MHDLGKKKDLLSDPEEMAYNFYMCRSIKTLYNFDPPSSEKEIYEASLQFVRKISGFRNPSKINEKTFQNATKRIEKDVAILLSSLKTKSNPRSRIKKYRNDSAKIDIIIT